MKTINSLTLFTFLIIALGCKNQQANNSSVVSEPAAVSTTDDNRPRTELSFLNRIKAESDYEVTSNAVKKDTHIAAFNKFALDSLKKIDRWEMIVTEINDDTMDANSLAKMAFNLNDNPIYNLKLVAPITPDKTTDTIGIENRVDFTYTIPKTPKGDSLKTQLSVIKTLSKGDIVLVSGALTHIDESGKVNFAFFYDQSQPWKIDLLLTHIVKKSAKQ